MGNITKLMDDKSIELLDKKWQETLKEIGEKAASAKPSGCMFCGGNELEIKETHSEGDMHIAEYMGQYKILGYYQCKKCERVVGKYDSGEIKYG